MRRASKLAAVAAALVAALTAMLLAGCGGGGEEGTETTSQAAFRAAADRICAEVARADIETRHRDLGTLAYLEHLRDDRERALAELEALQAPDDVATAYDAYLEARRRSLVGIDEGTAAARSEEPQAVEEFRAAARGRVEEGLKLAGEAGLVACAGELSPAERKAAEEPIALSVQPRRAREFCTRRTSAAMVESSFDGVADCVRRQSHRSRDDTASVEQISGIDGVGATAVVAVGRSGGDEEAYEAALVYEDGVWKLDAVSAAPSESGS
jgi:hypothetical protein